MAIREATADTQQHIKEEAAIAARVIALMRAEQKTRVHTSKSTRNATAAPTKARVGVSGESSVSVDSAPVNADRSHLRRKSKKTLNLSGTFDSVIDNNYFAPTDDGVSVTVASELDQQQRRGRLRSHSADPSSLPASQSDRSHSRGRVERVRSSSGKGLRSDLAVDSSLGVGGNCSDAELATGHVVTTCKLNVSAVAMTSTESAIDSHHCVDSVNNSSSQITGHHPSSNAQLQQYQLPAGTAGDSSVDPLTYFIRERENLSQREMYESTHSSPSDPHVADNAGVGKASVEKRELSDDSRSDDVGDSGTEVLSV